MNNYNYIFKIQYNLLNFFFIILLKHQRNIKSLSIKTMLRVKEKRKKLETGQEVNERIKDPTCSLNKKSELFSQ